MGGGEVARYIARHGEQRVSKVAFIASVTPFLLRTATNPHGAPAEIFADMRAAVQANRSQWTRDVTMPYYSYNRSGAHVSEGVRVDYWRQGMETGILAAYHAITAFSETDFREDLAKITVPALVVHGTDDQIVPIEISGNLMAGFVKHAELTAYQGGSHGLLITQKDRLKRRSARVLPVVSRSAQPALSAACPGHWTAQTGHASHQRNTQMRTSSFRDYPSPPSAWRSCRVARTRTRQTRVGSTVSRNDVAFVTNLYNVVDFDRAIIGPALARNPDPRVAQLAKDFLAQANALEARVRPIAEQEGIQPPNGQRFTQRADLQTRIASEIQYSRVDFDQEFLTDEIFSHEDALQSARDMANSPDGNPQLKAISATATGILATNLDRLKKLQSQLLASN